MPATVRKRAVEAIQNGIPKSTVAQAIRGSRLTVDRWLEKFVNQGTAGLERKPGSGRPILEKRIASPEINDFLGQMLRHRSQRHLVVVMDQAPPHTSRKTKAIIDPLARLHVFHLPKYSPDWNPDEKVWNHRKHQELKSHQAKTKAEPRHLTRCKLQPMAEPAQHAAQRALGRSLALACEVGIYRTLLADGRLRRCHAKRPANPHKVST